MNHVDFGKRRLLAQTSLLGVAALMPASLRAADELRIGPLKISDVPVPEFLGSMVDDVIALELDADRRRLPKSTLPKLSKIKIDPMALLEGDTLYATLMPHLVTLVDRSERIDPDFADKAGGLLAKLHAGEREVPAWLRMPGGGLTLPDNGGPLMMADGTISPDLAPVEDAREGGGIFEGAAPAPPPPPPPEPAPPVLAAPSAPPKPTEPIPLSRARNYAALREEYRLLFDTATPREAYADSLNWNVSMLRAARTRYEKVSTATGVPWHVIAVIHALEASFNFRAHLHNGDFPLSQRTRQVPAGRPTTWLPPSDWESSAKDALKLLGFTRETDWSVERTLYRLESYNGFGYRNVGIATPYLWSYSNHYEKGKFVSDGSYNAKARSQQCGTAIMLKSLADAGDISFPA
jgi:lysozyme family protein